MKNLFLAGAAALAICVASVPASALNSDCVNKIIDVYNESSYTVWSIYAKCVDCTEWSGDYLGDYVLHPGESWTIDGDYAPGSAAGYHVYNLKAVSDEGVEWNHRIDLCTATSWTLHD